jgi:hypothetical protein
VVVVRNGKQLLALFASEWHGVLDDARERLEPVVVELAEKDALAARLQRSPDLLDAILMPFTFSE